jgi:NAD(P)-dependent dehydrogenase (short-subunit alcohol dehydrogenase family)
VITVTGDVGKREDAERAVERTVEEYGGLDVLVNNAGIIQVGPLDHVKLEDFEDSMRVHFWGPLYTALAARPYLRRKREGRVVNIASIGGRISVPHLLPYSASKFALVGLSDGLRAELVRDGIHVTTVSPGLMRTGSAFNALFRGKQKLEFNLFTVLDTVPITSIGAEEAARQIVEACRHGDPELTITVVAQLMAKANAVMPGITARVMQLTSAILPKATGREGDDLKTGWESQIPKLVHSPLLQPNFDAAERNNELDSGLIGGRISR